MNSKTALTALALFLSLLACVFAQVPPTIVGPVGETQAEQEQEPEGQQGKQDQEQSKVLDRATDGPVTFNFEKGFDHTAIAIELSPDGSMLATGGLDKDVRIYSTKDWKQLAKSDAPQGMVLDLLFSSDGKRLVSCGDPKQVLVYDTDELNVLFDYRVTFRPERLAEAEDNQVAIAGRSGYRSLAGLSKNRMSRGPKVHYNFIGGLTSSRSPRIVYSAGNQRSGPYHLSRRVKSTQIIAAVPGRPARVAMGRDEGEVLVTTEKKAVVIDVIRKKTVETWELPQAQKVEDIFYWQAHDLYVTSDKQGFVKLWKRGHAEPIAQHRASDHDIYQVLALDDSRIGICGRQEKPRSISIWKLTFDNRKMPVAKARVIAATGEPSSDNQVEPDETATSTAASFVDLNSEYEIKRISPADLKLRDDEPSTLAELEWQVTQLEAVGEPVPESLKNFTPVLITDAVVSPARKTLYLATNEGLISYQDNKANLIQTRNKKPLMARTLARDAVDGILIGEEGGHKIYELRESGKLVYRGKAAPEEPDNENQAISRIIMSGSNYLALASKSSLRRRLTDGEWITEGLKDDTPILDFAIWGSGEYATIDKMNPKITIHPETGKKRDIRFDRKHGSKNELISKASDLKSTKVIAGVDGDVFAVFKRTRSQSDMGSSQTFSESDTQPVTCGWASFNGSIFDNILTYQDIDWSIAEPHKTRKLVVDFHLGPSKKYDDVWFLTPKGLGRLNKGKTEYWDTPFELEDGIELSTIRDLGDDNFMLFTTDGLFTHDVYHLRRKK